MVYLFDAGVRWMHRSLLTDNVHVYAFFFCVIIDAVCCLFVMYFDWMKNKGYGYSRAIRSVDS